MQKSSVKRIHCYSRYSSENYQSILNLAKEDQIAIRKTREINQRIRKEENEDYSKLLNELLKLEKEVVADMLKRMRNQYVVSRTEKLLDLIKGAVSKKTGKKPKPSNLGFKKRVNERLGFLKAIKSFKQSLRNVEKTDKISIGYLPYKEAIYLKVTIKSMKKDEKYKKGSRFDKARIRFNRDIIKKIVEFDYKKFNEVNSLLDESEVKVDINEFFHDIVRKHSEVIRYDGSPYNPSEGEKVILSISGLLEDSTSDCYIFDEIERGLGHKYISDYLIPRLCELRDIGKMIVLSTHNANVAVNTLPTHSVFCDYRGNDHNNIYYAGNMYSNELISINGLDILDWEEKALKHLEGSKEMFGVRENIWK